MCLYIDENVHTKRIKYRNQNVPEPLIADKDIPCIKYLLVKFIGNMIDDNNVPCNKYYTTPYMGARVRFNKNRIAELVSDIENEALPFTYEIYSNFSVEHGIYSYVRENGREMVLNVFRTVPSTLFKAIIPRGAMYYVGQDSDLVSNRLLIFEDEDAYQKYLKE